MDRPKRVYIAGPMTGIENFNRDAFNAAAKKLVSLGYEVSNPAQVQIDNGSWSDYMRRDIGMLVNCDVAVALKGWVNSHGATVEHQLCRDLEIPWFDYADFISDGNEELERLIHSNQA